MKNLTSLRKVMKDLDLDYCLVPTADAHGSEYIADYFKDRQFITNFTGSAGTAIISHDEAFLWTDGRYFIQAEKEIEGSGFSLMKQGLDNVLNPDQWLETKEGRLGVNFKNISHDFFINLEKKLKDIEIVDVDPISDVWERPVLEFNDIFEHDICYAGYSRESKISSIRDYLKKKNCEMTVITALDEISWILNLRGSDIYDTPVFLSYLIIDQNSTKLFANKTAAANLNLADIEIYDYEFFYQYLKDIENKRIYLDPLRTNEKIFNELKDSNDLVEGDNFSAYQKAKKNDIEIKNLRKASIRDGAHLTKFIYWIKNEIKKREVSEIEAARVLNDIRKKDKLYKSDSFEAISAYGENAAMMHYNCKNFNAVLKPKGLYLIDSGAQYLDGTTDITRTLALGELTEEEITDFTVVLKAHLHLMKAIFLKGTPGASLDAITRYTTWQHHYDYKCGTGHGVGFFLSVHEGPQRLAPGNYVPLELGMMVSNEPGIYREKKHGIRTENIMIVKEDYKDIDTFYSFETISLAPIDIDAINLDMLNDDELKLLNDYHKRVYDNLESYMDEDEKIWLREVTKELVR